MMPSKPPEYEPAIRARFITKIRAKLREGLALRADARLATEGQE
jgi:hypothetical protein